MPCQGITCYFKSFNHLLSDMSLVPTMIKVTQEDLCLYLDNCNFTNDNHQLRGIRVGNLNSMVIFFFSLPLRMTVSPIC